jgi:hypothetical protein
VGHRFWKCEDFKKLSPEEKYEKVKKMNLCFNCFGMNHQAFKCTSTFTCREPDCGAKHHTSLHTYYKEKEKADNPENAEQKADETHISMINSSQTEVFLKVVPVKLKGRNGSSLFTYAILDDCSRSTLIREDIAKQLGLKGKPKYMNLNTVKGEGDSVLLRVDTLDVAARDESYSVNVPTVLIVSRNDFHMPSQILNDTPSYDLGEHLQGINVPSVSSDEISILIGANAAEALLYDEVRLGRPHEPLAVRTKFGWTLFGGTPSDNPSLSTTCNILHTSETNDRLHSMMERFWVQESSVTDRIPAMSRQDKMAEAKLEEHKRVVNGKYELPMLWADENADLPNNYALAKQRFRSLEKRLKANPDLLRMYNEVITGYLDKGYARVMTPDEVKQTSSRTRYLPHHPVFNPNKPGKMRVVFDLAAKFKGRSTNDELITGPDLLNNLEGVFLRFRSHPVAIAADIEAMFLQIRVPATDADALRFLWKTDFHSDNCPITLQMLVHVFGAKDSPAAANFALKSAARDHSEDFDALTYETAIRSFYMDDLQKSVKTDEEAIRLALQLISLFNRAGFRLTKFVSNSETVMAALPSSERSIVEFGASSESFQRALAAIWEINSDVITFRARNIEAPETKRGIAGVVASIYDPTGLVGPFTVKGKIILQELWRRGYCWDSPVEGHILRCWKSWVDGAAKVDNFQVRRCFYSEDPSDVELHIFGDASEVAYGAVAYLRFVTKTGALETSLVSSKSRLAPIRSITLPRLELNAAVTAVRLYRKLIYELDYPIQKTQFYTDSTLTLQYLRNETLRLLTFESNRVSEICEVSDAWLQWLHIAGDKNPADILTRGVSDPTKLMTPTKTDTCWPTGPQCLRDGETPPQPDLNPLDESDPAIRKKDVLVALTTLDPPLIDIERFSRWSRCKRSVAWLLRFTHNCKERDATKKLSGENLSPGEINQAEMVIIRRVQLEAFGDELNSLHKGNHVSNRSKLSQLSPFLDAQGLLRVGGRLKNAPIPFNAKHQLILPQYHHMTTLLIRHEHEKNGHIGREHVLSNLRQSYWIVGGRSAVKGILFRCIPCRKRKAKTLTPLMADLPAGRLALGQPPFTNCGVDLFGPVSIKHGRQRLKRWGVIFTCLTTRATHLESVENADADAFINALRRFTNRRGKPNIMYADCGTNFKGASSELKEAYKVLRHDDVAAYFEGAEIQWKFNPPGAPHMGGVWERLIRSVKRVMAAIMKDVVLTDYQFITLLTEVERILNDRPLTPVSDDPDDLEALTPSHALLGHHRNWNSMSSAPQLTSRKRWKQVQFMSDNFWKRWRKEYLPLLTSRSCWRRKTRNISVDDLVLVNDPDVPKGVWPLGRIKSVFKGTDGVVRSVEVRTKRGVFMRPVTKLVDLEELNVPQGGEDVSVVPPRTD